MAAARHGWWRHRINPERETRSEITPPTTESLDGFEGAGIQDQASALRRDIMAKPQSKQLVVCIENEGYLASLEKRKIYVALRDPAAEKHRLLRVIDESGEDYLYPKVFFRAIALPQAIRKALLAAA
jgi:hypothetical protein